MSETNLPQPENHGSRGGATGGGSREPPRPGHRWLGGLLGLAAVLLAVVLVIILPQLGSAPRGGRPGAAGAPATSSASQSVGGLLFVREGVLPGSYNVWIATPDGKGQHDLTRDRASDTDPDWSPDGARIAYIRSDGARSRIWMMRADGSGQRQLTDDPGLAPDWSPDGKRLLYLHVGSGNRPVYTINGDGSARRRLGSVSDVRTARWSPDGTRIALTAHDAVWIVNADGTGLHRIRQSAAYPSWTPDGRQLVFLSYASAPTGGPELRRMDTEGRNEVVLGGDQADAAPKLR